MTFPDQHTTMLLLIALHLGDRLDAEDGVTTLRVGGGEPVAIPSLADALDDLEQRSWIVVGDAGPAVTDRGRYALKRFVETRLGKKAAAKVLAGGVKLVRVN